MECSGSENKDESKDLQNKKIKDNLVKIKRKITVMSGKGGVGKSTIAVNLAVYLAEKGFKTGLMDVDLHGPSVPTILGVKGFPVGLDDGIITPVIYSENLKVISIEGLLKNTDDALIWRGPMKIGVIRQFIADIGWGDLDFLIIDAPPGTGDEPLTVAQDIAGAEALIITTPQEVSLSDVRKSVNFCKQLKMPILGLIENMSGFVCSCGKKTDIFKSGTIEAAAEKMGVKYLGSIPIEVEIMASSDKGLPFVRNNDSATASAFKKIADKII
jgi:Mrp family chromosome partitioning ATPase